MLITHTRQSNSRNYNRSQWSWPIATHSITKWMMRCIVHDRLRDEGRNGIQWSWPIATHSITKWMMRCIVHDRLRDEGRNGIVVRLMGARRVYYRWRRIARETREQKNRKYGQELEPRW
ncbi:hypothetical protein QE152_g8 [Popillia japonica]|uniref:Uncharacterized protein n=1 Tax=Popillia japonica TaxID=7064 RepID=A0AAW1NMJ8_POPJA